MKAHRFVLFVYGFTFLVFPGYVQALDTYPNRPVELVVPFSPGGSTDLQARMYSEKLARILKSRIIVVNRGAGGGIQGVVYASRAKKDGYTLLASGNSMTFNSFNREATYRPLKDFIPLGQLSSIPQVFSVRADSPFKTFGELVEYARKNPDKLTNAEGGGMSPAWLNLALLRTKNIHITIVPFTGGGEATLALLGNHVDMTSSGLMNAGPHIKAGKLRALAITSKKRFPLFPDIPTTAELGYPYLAVNGWTGTFAPSGIPKSVFNVLVPALEKAFTDPEILKSLSAANVISDYRGPEEFQKLIESEMNLLGNVLKDALQ